MVWLCLGASLTWLSVANEKLPGEIWTKKITSLVIENKTWSGYVNKQQPGYVSAINKNTKKQTRTELKHHLSLRKVSELME